MVIHLTDYFRCDCGSLAHKVAETDDAIVYRCKCGAVITYLPGECWHVDYSDDYTIEWTPSRWMYLRLAWDNVKAFIRGR
jgi:hypothetical protein